MKKIYGVEGVEGKRSSDRNYSHAVVAVVDVVSRAKSSVEYAKSAQSAKNAHWSHGYAVKALELGAGGSYVPEGWSFKKVIGEADVASAKERLAKYPSAEAEIAGDIAEREAALVTAKAAAAAGIAPEIVSFHSSRPLALKAANALEAQHGWLNVDVRETYRIK